MSHVITHRKFSLDEVLLKAELSSVRSARPAVNLTGTAATRELPYPLGAFVIDHQRDRFLIDSEAVVK